MHNGKCTCRSAARCGEMAYYHVARQPMAAGCGKGSRRRRNASRSKTAVYHVAGGLPAAGLSINRLHAIGCRRNILAGSQTLILVAPATRPWHYRSKGIEVVSVHGRPRNHPRRSVGYSCLGRSGGPRDRTSSGRRRLEQTPATAACTRSWQDWHCGTCRCASVSPCDTCMNVARHRYKKPLLYLRTVNLIVYIA